MVVTQERNLYAEIVLSKYGKFNFNLIILTIENRDTLYTTANNSQTHTPTHTSI